MERYKWSFVSAIIGGIFFLTGIIFIIIGAVNVAGWNDFKKDAVPVTATITDISTHTTRRPGSNKRRRTYDVNIEYEYDGKSYSGDLSYYTSGMREGGAVDIFIDPDDPYKHRSEPYLVSGMMAVFGLVFGGIGAAFLGHEIKKSKYINRLIAEGKFIYADYSGEEQANVTVNNVRYRQAVFVYEDGFGKKLTFKSEPYHPNSCPYSQGDTKKVYVDMETDPKRYYVSREK